jgi:UDP-glucuronate 4-epimerase
LEYALGIRAFAGTVDVVAKIAWTFRKTEGLVMKILVTGAAGFIGMTATLKLLARGDEVVGLDNLNDYYDVTLKQSRLARLTPHASFRFVQLDVADREGIARLFAAEKFDRVIHLAAQAGVCVIR